jgi:hypothetical protein
LGDRFDGAGVGFASCRHPADWALGEVTAGRVLFGPDDIPPLLGATALESVGFVVDPVNQQLKRLPAIPLY